MDTKKVAFKTIDKLNKELLGANVENDEHLTIKKNVEKDELDGLINNYNEGNKLSEINIMRIDRLAKLPVRGKSADAGLDLYAIEDVEIKAGHSALIKTGIAIDIPVGYEGTVRGRSGRTRDSDLRINLGTIDSGYLGEIGILAESRFNFKNWLFRKKTIISKGDKIAQLVISPTAMPTPKIVVDFNKETERGSSGFGSTGNK